MLDVFPANISQERMYWVLGICFSKVTFLEEKRVAIKYYTAQFTYMIEKDFVLFIKEKIFKIDRELYQAQQRNSKIRYGFGFPQAEKDYYHYFRSMGIVPKKEMREFPTYIPEKMIKHLPCPPSM